MSGARAVSPRQPALEGLRAVAAGAVMVTHVAFLSGAVGGHVLPGFLGRMDIGVAVFFVLSGYLLYLPHARSTTLGRRPTPLREYAIRRAARLLPAWAAVLAGTWLLVPSVRQAPGQTWVAQLTMTQIYRLGHTLGPLNQLWSLSTEVAFYLVLPVLALALRALARRSRSPVAGQLVALTVLAAGSIVFRVGVDEGWWASRLALQWLPAHLDWFAVGMAVALVRAERDAGRESTAGLLLVSAGGPLRVLAALLLWLATTPLAGPLDLAPATTSQDLLKHLLYAAVAGLLVGPVALHGGDRVGRLLSGRVAVRLGRVSYGVFLWHLPILYAVRRSLGLVTFAGGFWITLACTGALSLLVAEVSWRLLEQPIVAAAHRQRSAVAPDPAPDRQPVPQPVP